MPKDLTTDRPFLSSRFSDTMVGAPYAGAFLALALVCVLLALSQMFLSVELGRDDKLSITGSDAGDRLELRGGFLKASVICAVGFAVMTLIMNAAPLSIHQCGYSIQESGTVLQVHFALMYLPSFLNPVLIKYFGVRGLVTLGIFASGIGSLLTVVTEQTLAMYMIELGLSGIGWNFMFNGGTLLLATTYPSTLKTKAQGLNSMLVYSANVFTSFSAGVLVATSGWVMLNLVALPLLLAAFWSLRFNREQYLQV